MGVVDGFKSASIFGKIAFILLAVASFCIIIAFTCTGWGESNTTVGGGYRIHWGLWRRCTEEEVSTAPCSPLDGWANGMSFRLFFLFFVFLFFAFLKIQSSFQEFYVNLKLHFLRNFCSKYSLLFCNDFEI